MSNPHEFVLPERGVVATVVRKVTETLAKAGIRAVCCGGAARDAYHFVPPKDFDFIVLDGKNDGDLTQATTVGHALDADTDYAGVGIMLSYTDESTMQLQWVIKAQYKGHVIDIISPMQRCTTPEDAVRTLDLTLNAAWIDVSTADTLCVTLAGVYPDVSEDFPVRLMSPQSCTAERVDYIRSKYPQYRYDISAEDLLPPKTEGAPCAEN